MRYNLQLQKNKKKFFLQKVTIIYSVQKKERNRLMKKYYLDLILYKIGQNCKKQSLNCEISIRIVKSIFFFKNNLSYE